MTASEAHDLKFCNEVDDPVELAIMLRDGRVYCVNGLGLVSCELLQRVIAENAYIIVKLTLCRKILTCRITRRGHRVIMYA